MEFLEPVVLKDSDEVDARLSAFGLQRDRLVAAGRHALAARRAASPLHPANAAGYFSYADGVRGLRVENLGDGWDLFQSEGLEGIENFERKLRVLFSNVLTACASEEPQARSRKGAGSERVTSGNLFEDAGISLPVAVSYNDDYRTYYLMVDQNGAMELSQPVVSGGKFQCCVERLFLQLAEEFDASVLDFDEPNDVPELDVVVSRK